jgi:pimeloyl-ACP methyl ester carboxylesterase
MTPCAHNGNVRIAYEDLGGTGGDPLLLVMGLGTSRFWWPGGLVDELVRRGFHVVAYDQRDAGESTHVPAPPAGSPVRALLRRTPPAYTAEDQTDDAVAVLDALGWDCAHLFGHSMGGLVAQRTAVRHPGRVLSLTSSSAVPSDATGLGVLKYLHVGTVARFMRLREPDTTDGDLALALAMSRLLAAPGQVVDEAEVRGFVQQDGAHGVRTFRDTQAQSRQIGATWSGGSLAEVTAPTLVLHGEGDPLLRVSAARDTAAAVRGAHLRTFPGVGHFLSSRTWADYADEVRALADRAADPRP